MEENKIVIYQTEDGQTQIDVRLEKEATCAKTTQVREEGFRLVTHHISTVLTAASAWPTIPSSL